MLGGGGFCFDVGCCGGVDCFVGACSLCYGVRVAMFVKDTETSDDFDDDVVIIETYLSPCGVLLLIEPCKSCKCSACEACVVTDIHYTTIFGDCRSARSLGGKDSHMSSVASYESKRCGSSLADSSVRNSD